VAVKDIIIILLNNSMVIGRPPGAQNRTNYKWLLTVFDKESNTFVRGKYSTVREMNEDRGTEWSCDFINRLHSRKGISQKPNSVFIKKHGHLNLEKICEPRVIENNV